jgi:5-hydroxyisourate hydrolase
MISTQVIDSGSGRPVPGLPVELDVFITGHGWRQIGHGVTNDNGEIEDFAEPPAEGVYRLVFDIGAQKPDAFFPSISITFEVREPAEHYHLPLQLSAYGYSTYRGV